jgi:nucleotide-binding universal stress UspA family protein
MLQRILVPIDGSELSERALALTTTFARAQAAEVILVRVVEPPLWYDPEPDGITSADIYQELVDAVEQEAQAYLDRLVTQLEADGLRVRGELLHGSPSPVLLEYEERVQPDLIIMGTHGRSGIQRFALGSIADRLVREGTVPVLLIRSLSPALSVAEGALVPLDGSRTAEQALPMVKMLAGKPLRRIRLLRAIATADEWATASQYLEDIAHQLTTSGLEVETTVRMDEPSVAIVSEAPSAHLVIISTHGRSGFDRLRHGSIADQVVHQSTVPTLLVRAQPLTTEEIAPEILPRAVKLA